MNLDIVARDKALKTLQRGFDVEAYLVLGMAESRLGTVDRMPESGIDENISTMGDQFVKYMNTKAGYRNGKIKDDQLLQELDGFLQYMRKIIAELYHSCDLKTEREKIKDFTDQISDAILK